MDVSDLAVCFRDWSDNLFDVVQIVKRKSFHLPRPKFQFLLLLSQQISNLNRQFSSIKFFNFTI